VCQHLNKNLKKNYVTSLQRMRHERKMWFWHHHNRVAKSNSDAGTSHVYYLLPEEQQHMLQQQATSCVMQHKLQQQVQTLKQAVFCCCLVRSLHLSMHYLRVCIGCIQRVCVGDGHSSSDKSAFIENSASLPSLVSEHIIRRHHDKAGILLHSRELSTSSDRLE